MWNQKMPRHDRRAWSRKLNTSWTLVLVMAFLIPFHAQIVALAADHNDPNAVNSIFSDISVSAADLYDMFGFPSDDEAGGEKVVLALTFAPVPETGVFDTDMLYRIKLNPAPRIPALTKEDHSLDVILAYAEAIKANYVTGKASEIRVTVDQNGRAKIAFVNFPSGDFSQIIDLNKVVTIPTPNGHVIKAYLGGRDDAFFNDLPGFFRSINYAPQFYHVPQVMTDARELKIPKTLLELDGNKLFNFDPEKPQHGQGLKEDLPTDPLTWTGNKYLKDENGNYRFVYSGRDAQAGRNVNAIVIEVPLDFITPSPKHDRIVNAWGESWVLKASPKLDTIPDDTTSFFRKIWLWVKGAFPTSESSFAEDLKKYKLIDTDGVPFADAALSEREDTRQLGADNEKLARHFVMRLGHLGWGFGPSISALGLGTCFDHDNSPVSVHRTYALATEAFPRVKKCLFQEVNMPDATWNKRGLDIKLKRSFEIFIPNACAIDMDTTGTWPFGRRLEDQVANRFLSIFLDMKAGCGGMKCNVETFSDQFLWDHAPVVPKTSPNPLRNDKPFLAQFPYLADPH